MKKDTLFLHMGPGFNSFVEREILGPSMKSTHFWDQPPIKTEKDAFGTLVEAALNELDTIYSETNTPVKLFSHCFGIRIAQQLLLRAPEKISECHFVNSSFDIPHGFFNLLKIMSRSKEIDPSLGKKMAIYIQNKSTAQGKREEVWEYIQLIAEEPMYIKYYWPKVNQFNAYAKIAASGPPFDFMTFQLVLNDFLNHYFDQEMIFKGNHKITFELGKQSPLVEVENEIPKWKTQFPKAEFSINPNGGHFMHLEGHL